MRKKINAGSSRLLAAFPASGDGVGLALRDLGELREGLLVANSQIG